MTEKQSVLFKIVVKTFFLILSLSFAVQAFSKQNLGSPSGQKSVSKSEPALQTGKAKKIKAAKDCNSSAQSQRSLKSYTFKGVFSIPDSQIEDLVNSHFPYIQKGWPKQCPEHCEQINNYKIVSKTYPTDIKKGSCKKEEAKESYSLKKQFAFQKDKNSVVKAHKEMWEWIFSVFIYPYYPFVKPSKEFIENKLLEACPSCSFYFDYNYKYTKNNYLDLSITARCGDRRNLLSSFKAEFILVNDWKCKKRTKEFKEKLK